MLYALKWLTLIPPILYRQGCLYPLLNPALQVSAHLKLFCIDQNTAENWKLFKQKWQLYTTFTDLTKQQYQYQVALLLHSLSDDALRVYNGFKFYTPNNDRTVQEIIEHCDNYSMPLEK